MVTIQHDESCVAGQARILWEVKGMVTPLGRLSHDSRKQIADSIALRGNTGLRASVLVMSPELERVANSAPAGKHPQCGPQGSHR